MAIPREVGKQKRATNTEVLRVFKTTLQLSDLQRQLVFGTILGDGCLITSRSGKAARLQIRHNVKHKEFVLWKYAFFREWVLTPPRDDFYNNSFYFRTVSHPDLMKIKQVYYQGVRKLIPENIVEYLKSPLSLAIWCMDDGNGDKTKICFRISSYGFGYEGNILLQASLETNFNLPTRIYKDSKGYYLWFPKSSALDLYQIVKPYIVPCMRYKFANLTP